MHKPPGRRRWTFNPAPRVVASGKVYKRAQAAQAARHDAQDEEVDMFNLSLWPHCSKAHAEAVSGTIRGPHVWISIGDPGEPGPYWTDNPHRLGIHRLEVYDSLLRAAVLQADGPALFPERQPMTALQAKAVHHFLYSYPTTTAVFVHCHAGMARSPAVVKALALGYVHPQASPTPHVLRAFDAIPNSFRWMR